MKGRISYIDGIRGIAVLMVTFCHFSSIFLYNIKDVANVEGIIFNNTPLSFVIYGNTSVQCFFILSGFLIASNIYQFGLKNYSPLKTYKKLFRIILPAIVLVFLLMSFGLVFHTKAADIYPELSYAYQYNNFVPSFGLMVKEIFYTTFFKSSSQYVPPFWTMSYEFVGSIFTTLLVYLTKNQPKRNRYILYICLCFIILFMFSDSYMSFILGTLLFEIQSDINDSRNALKVQKIKSIFLIKLCLVFLMLLGIYFAGAADGYSGIYRILAYIPGLSNHPVIFRSGGVFLCLLVILNSQWLKKILAFKAISFIGNNSGYIYAFHWTVIISLGCGMYMLCIEYLPKWLLLPILFCFAVGVPIALGYGCKALYKQVDKLEKKLFMVLQKQN